MGRGIRFGHIAAGLILAVSVSIGAQAQMGGHRGTANNHDPLANPNPGPKAEDPESHDAIDLFSHLCVSTYGDFARAKGIVGEGDSAVEKMEPPLLRGLEDGKSGGAGWIIRMPLGEKLLLDFPPDGACVVRAPRVNAAQLETAFRNLLDQYGASGTFKIKREGEQTKTVDAAVTHQEGKHQEGEPQAKEKVKFHILTYSMILPDSGKSVILGLATTDSKSIPIQAILSFETPSGTSHQ
jgi:hypothetical protein